MFYSVYLVKYGKDDWNVIVVMYFWAIFQLLHHLFHKLVFMYPIIVFLIPTLFAIFNVFQY